MPEPAVRFSSAEPGRLRCFDASHLAAAPPRRLMGLVTFLLDTKTMGWAFRSLRTLVLLFFAIIHAARTTRSRYRCLRGKGKSDKCL
jgi:hypothetical protein